MTVFKRFLVYVYLHLHAKSTSFLLFSFLIYSLFFLFISFFLYYYFSLLLFFIESSMNAFGFSTKPNGQWHGKKINKRRSFLEEYAKSRNFDPLLPSTWYSLQEKIVKNKVKNLSGFCLFCLLSPIYFLLLSRLLIIFIAC